MRTLAIVCLVVALLAVAQGCSRGFPLPEGTSVLFRSERTHAVNAMEQQAMLFEDGTHVLLTDSIFDIDALRIADLAAGTVTRIEIPKQGFDTFQPAPGGIIVFEGGFPASHHVLLVSPTGQVKKLELLELWLGQIDNYGPIEAASARMQSLAAAGELDGLTEIIEHPVDGRAPRTIGFINDRYYLSVNEANERDLPTLRAHSTGTYTWDATAVHDPDTTASVLQFTVTRNPFVSYAGDSDNRNITRIDVAREGVTVRSIDLSVGFYHHAMVVGDRLYIVGDDIVYVPLNEL